MAFSSHSGNTRRGGWANSILPSTNPKSKLPRKSRRRTLFREFIFSNFFSIGLSVSVFILILVVLRYGVPKPISMHFKSRTSRFSKLRKQASRKPAFQESRVSTSAAVDITTKDLYDKVEFLDVDGGPWKQGWRVSYKGDEWDSEKLKVFVVPHSHNDPGWKRTVEEYYQQQSRHILDTIIETLSKDSKRKFIWEEMSYLERWWRDASTASKHTFTRLVKNGQLEIVGGGWVMNDEANSHYFAIIEQITEGNLWLNDTIGVVPKNSWAIDPFGYSPTMAYLLRRMGFENMVIQRTHYELKKELALHKNLEYIWRQSWDFEETTDIFVHMMPFYSYDIPHTCGPEPAICCQFDFARMHGSSYELCPWGQNPTEIDTFNVHEKALKLLDQYKKKSTLYRTNTLLVPLGDDFRFMSVEEAESQFRNYEMLFDYINSSPSLNSEVKFGTLEDYFSTLREETERINYSLPGEIGSGEVVGFPSLHGDFFTYADRERDYWSGYYVSRPFFKAVDRVLEQTLRATDMMISLLLGHCHRALCEKLPVSFAYKLTAAKRNLALFQHHDGVTGTAKDHVVVDYGSRMFTSLHDLQVFMSRGVEVLLGIRHEKPGQNLPLFEAAEVRSKFDVQALHREIPGREGTGQTVVLFNPLEQNRNEVVMVVVRRFDVTVLDWNWTCVKSQVSPQFQYDVKGEIFTGRHRLHWTAFVPAMGLQTYYIVSGFNGCEKSKPAKIKLSSNSKPLSPYDCSNIEDGDVVEIKNRHMKLAIDAKLGLLQFVTNINGTVTAVGEEISMYSSSGSGAYLFKPNGEAESINGLGGKIVIVEGPLMQEVFAYPETLKHNGRTPLSHSTRIYNGDNTMQEFVIEKEYHVELTGEEFNDKELIARYKTNIENRRVFYSDLNGFQTIRRETYDKIPLQGNYYPMPSMAFMQGNHGRRFSVHSRQSLGVASLKNGWIEIMLDRRLVSDDGRGLGQGVMDNKPMNVIFHILVESNKSSVPHIPRSSSLSPSILSHSIGARLNYPLLLFIAKKPHDISVRPTMRPFSPLASPFPCDLHVVSLKVHRLLKYSEESRDEAEPRFSLVLHRRNWDPSYCREGRSDCKSLANEVVNLTRIFKGVSVRNVKPTSLNLLHEDLEMLGYGERFFDGGEEERVLMAPMEIRAYKLELRAHQQERNSDSSFF